MLTAILAQILKTVNIYSGSVLCLFNSQFRVSLCSTSSVSSIMKRCRYALVLFLFSQRSIPQLQILLMCHYTFKLSFCSSQILMEQGPNTILSIFMPWFPWERKLGGVPAGKESAQVISQPVDAFRFSRLNSEVLGLREKLSHKHNLFLCSFGYLHIPHDS